MDTIANIAELQHRIALYDDMNAYKRLYEVFFTPLFRLSHTLVKSREAAEEIVSDVFLKLWQMRSRLAEVDNLKVYLYIITKNLSLNYITRNYKNPIVQLERMHLEFAADLSLPDELCISTDMAARIHKSMNELPPQCKLIFQLVKQDGMKYKEVAEILDISVLTVRNQVAIAVKKMGESLKPYLPSMRLTSQPPLNNN